MAGYTGFLHQSHIKQLAEQILEKIKDRGLFTDLVNNAEFKERVTESLSKTINNAFQSGVPVTQLLNDKEGFATKMVLDLAIQHHFLSKDVPKPDTTVLFIDKEKDPEKYEIALRKFYKDILTEQFKPELESKKLTEKDIDNFVDKLIKNPELMLQTRKKDTPKPVPANSSDKEEQEKEDLFEMAMGVIARAGAYMPAAFQGGAKSNSLAWAAQYVYFQATNPMAKEELEDTTSTRDFAAVEIEARDRSMGISPDLIPDQSPDEELAESTLNTLVELGSETLTSFTHSNKLVKGG